MSERWLDAWYISEADYPAAGRRFEQCCCLLRYAVLAPSIYNTQPWRFKITDRAIELYADRTRALPVVDPEDRQLTISCGAALFHLRLAIRYFGHTDVTELLPDPHNPDLLARVRPGKARAATDEERRLFRTIPKRHTNRQPYEPRPIPESLRDALRASAEAEGAWLRMVEGEEARAHVADLIAEGDRLQITDIRFRREVAAWIHPLRTQSHNGIPEHAIKFGDLLSTTGPFMSRTAELGDFQAETDRHLVLGAPLLAVLGTDADHPLDWLRAGQALERTLLRARASEVWASFFNQPIEVARLRPRLRDLLGGTGFPQLLLRMGYGPPARPTPRRRLSEVLL